MSRVVGPEEHQQSLGEHLLELRARLVRAGVAAALTTAASLGLSRRLLSLMLRPVPETYFFAPGEAFAAHLRVAFLIGLPLAWPIVLYQIFAFTAPGLYPGERRSLALLLPVGTLLFALGIMFGYLVMIPVILAWLRGFATGGVTPAISVSLYTGFILSTVLPFGLTFQLPLVVGVLSWMGIVTARGMVAARRWVLLGTIAAAALLTPPDVVSQLLMALPIALLYEASIVIAGLVAQRRDG